MPSIWMKNLDKRVSFFIITDVSTSCLFYFYFFFKQNFYVSLKLQQIWKFSYESLFCFEIIISETNPSNWSLYYYFF